MNTTPDRDSPIRSAVLDAARQCFSESGYRGTSMKTLLDVAGVSRGGFYHYFSSKKDVLHVLHGEFIDRVLESFQTAEATKDSPEGRLRRFIHSYLQLITRDRDLAEIFFQEKNFHRDRGFADVMKKRKEVDSRLQALIGDGIQDGVFRKTLRGRLMDFALFGMLNWTYMWYRPDGPATVDDIADEFSEIMLRGIMADRAAPASA
ncbi:MAG TPA: TetR/AcrR family transcriptional regulator [Polyangiaceae bacterium LLY-WYZ-14_1]|jgi:AcrR family transcriptional regulator|nr:TetR/AcrR family transcriptional regulator [Polyangiaceae bacterium LLY-WYZ-14_1]